VLQSHDEADVITGRIILFPGLELFSILFINVTSEKISLFVRLKF